MNIVSRHPHARFATLALLTLMACTGKSEGPRGVAPTEAAPQARRPRPTTLQAPDGDFVVAHAVLVYDPMAGKDVPEHSADALTIESAPNNGLTVKLNVVAHNFDQCFFDQTMTPSGPSEWRWKGGEESPNCVVVLTQTESEIVVNSNWDCKDLFCGNRATLEGTFPLSTRKPVGTYEWPEL